MPVPERIFGWTPQMKDMRDYNLRDPRFFPKMALLPRVVYNHVPPVLNQLKEGSCVFHGTVESMEAVELALGRGDTTYSRQYGYYTYREKYGNVNVDDGAIIRVAVKMLAQQGICQEKLWPYSMDNFAVKPSEAAYADAPAHKIEAYVGITGVKGEAGSLRHDLCACLASGWNFVCGISCYTSIKSDEVANSGFVPYPSDGEECLGGHCVHFWGYDLHEEIFWGQNSWGNDWGCQAPTTSERGFFKIPMKYLENLASDFWSIRMTMDAEPQPAPAKAAA
jgi:C1A family cysteine protease